MERTYSVVFYSKTVIEPVKEFKDLLKSKIDWYNSCNSEAHITICEFTIEESGLKKIKQKLSDICDTFTPFQVYLDHFGSYDFAGAFFIGLNENPTIKKTQKPLIEINKKVVKPNSQQIEKLVIKTKLKSVMKKTQDSLKISNMKKSSDPHITVGRKLSLEKIPYFCCRK